MEVERRRRQLSEGRVSSSTLEQHQAHTRLRRQVRDASPGQTEDISQLRDASPGETEDISQLSPGDTEDISQLSPEQDRGRRQTSDPDQLCPTLASFVMPRAAVNSQGEDMTRSYMMSVTCISRVQVTGCTS